MSSAPDYDVIVLGAGAPGEHCAGALAAGGLSVAVVERELVGGECSYYACIPSKTLLRPGEAVQGARDAAGDAEVDVRAALAWRDSMVSGYTDTSAGALARRSRHRAAPRRGTAGRHRRRPSERKELHGRACRDRHRRRSHGAADSRAPPARRRLGDAGGDGLKAIPRRLLALGGGPAGVELAQVVRRLGGEAAIVERGDRLLPREPAPLGESLGEALRQEGIELVLGAEAVGARYDDGEYTLTLDNGDELRGDRLLVATGRRPRVNGIGLETGGVDPNPRGIAVDECLSAGERLWAIGDVTGIWPLTSVGEYQGDVVAASILGEPRPANYDAVPRVTFTDPQAAAVGVAEDRFTSTTMLTEESKLATYTRAHEHSKGFLTLVSDGNRLTGAYALGPEAGEWLQQATVAIRARIALDVLRDTIQPFPSFSRIYWAALTALQRQITGPPALARARA